LGPHGTAATNRPIVPTPGNYDDGENRWNDDWQGKLKCSEKTCPSATLSTASPTLFQGVKRNVNSVSCYILMETIAKETFC
jgi:hypothetical protein